MSTITLEDPERGGKEKQREREGDREGERQIGPTPSCVCDTEIADEEATTDLFLDARSGRYQTEDTLVAQTASLLFLLAYFKHQN